VSVTGIIEATVSFSDSAERQTKTILKNAAIEETSDVATAVVAIVTGTVGTFTEAISIDPTAYRNAAGDLVTFDPTPPTRIALVADGPARVNLSDTDLGRFRLTSSSGRVAMSDWSYATVGTGLSVGTSSGTNTYSIVIWR
jgi:hypothetical protein